MYKSAWCTYKVVVLPIGAVTRDTYDSFTAGNWRGAFDWTLPPLFTSPWGDSCIMFPVCIRLHGLIPIQSHSGMSSFRFSIQIKFSVWYEISFWFQVNWQRNSFPIALMHVYVTQANFTTKPRFEIKISEVSQKWIPRAVELKRIPTHKKCKCKKFCSQTRLVGEIYSSDVIMHRGYWKSLPV